MLKLYITVFSIFFILSDLALAQSSEFFIYPTQGQSAEQQDRDEFECHRWARDRTGFDPMQRPTASTPPPQRGATQGGVVRGGARGALVGTAAGAIAGNTGRGAAMGASSGALVGGMRRRDQRRSQQQAEQQWAQQEIARHEAQRNNFNRAFRSCMEGRGYTLN